MGLSPRQVDELSIWEFNAAIEGWKAINAAEGPLPPPTDAEHDALVAKYG